MHQPKSFWLLQGHGGQGCTLAACISVEQDGWSPALGRALIAFHMASPPEPPVPAALRTRPFGRMYGDFALQITEMGGTKIRQTNSIGLTVKIRKSQIPSCGHPF